jgi:hypothetical protein
VYDLENTEKPFSEFVLDKTELIKPHSNAVAFGCEYFEAGDEFPLLYTNVYNNYQGEENKRTGMCLVYRILRNENVFTSELVQIIEIGFTSDENYWKSEGIDDVRPYGNFVVDCEKNRYYAFTMIDKPKITRYFAFDLPKLSEGEMCREYGVSPEACMLKMNEEAGFAALFSTSSLSHLRNNLQELPDETYTAIKPVLDEEFPAPEHLYPLVKI